MSQTSFLESVVTWDEQQCQQNLDEALPKLIAHMESSEILQEEIGVLKIICLSFLPCVSVSDAERQLFPQITAKCCAVVDRLFQCIGDVPKQSEAITEVQGLLQLLVELLDCYTACIKHVQGTGDPVAIENMHSLPYGSVHLLKGTYMHCKESGDIYGESLVSLTEPLSLVFKKAHALQVALLGLLDTITIDGAATHQDVEDLCFICQGLFEVCQVVYALDMKLVCSLWKTISRFCSRHKSLVGPDLDVDGIIIYLCGEINSAYLYLYQLAPAPVTQELGLSQGDSAAFQKSVKIVGYQMRILVSLLDSFMDHISQCEANIVKLLIAIYRNVPPSLSAARISKTHVEEIGRQVVNGTEPIVSMLAGNSRFIEAVTASDPALQADDWFAYLLLCVKVMDFLPKQTDDVQDKWLAPKLYEGDIPRSSIIQSAFQAVTKCYVEMVVPVTLLGVECGGRPAGPVSLYHYVATHICGVAASLPARHVNVLEDCLLTNLLSGNLSVSTLAADVWCFMARFGSADLCYDHIRLLIDLTLMLKADRHSSVASVHCLIHRLLKFLAPEHQISLAKRYPLSSHVKVWKHIPLSVLSPNLRTEVAIAMVTDSLNRIQSFMQNAQKSYKDLLALLQALEVLSSVMIQQGMDVLPAPLRTSLLEGVGQLWSMWQVDWPGESLVSRCVQKMVYVTGQLVTELSNTTLLQVLDVLFSLVNRADTGLKVAAADFLQQCKTVRLAPCAKQAGILKRIAQLFRVILKAQHPIIHHCSVESFTKFAESTPHESVVPECLDNQAIQDTVVAFLSKVPHEYSDYNGLEYLKRQSCSSQQQDRIAHATSQQQDRTVPATSQQQNNTVQSTDIEQMEDTSVPSNIDEKKDFLDEIEVVTEPSAKRKRKQGDDGVLDNLVASMNSSIAQLESMCKDCPLPDCTRGQLTDLHARLAVILQDT